MPNISNILQGVRILSLALNLPGPAALMRCRAMGADCVKLEPPAGDPMQWYNAQAYQQMHEGVSVLVADLKSQAGQDVLHRQLAQADVLLTSFRPSALEKLGLGWNALHARHPALCQVSIVGASGAAAEEPGHDLTYMAALGLVSGLNLPPTLYADMGGALAATQAVLQAALLRRRQGDDPPPEGALIEVALSDAAAFLGLPRHWGLTRPEGAVGGAHAGYRVYACRDGRVAVAALEPHFATRLCAAVGVAVSDFHAMFKPETHEAVAAFMRNHSRAELDRLAADQDLPLHTMAAA